MIKPMTQFDHLLMNNLYSDEASKEIQQTLRHIFFLFKLSKIKKAFVSM